MDQYFYNSIHSDWANGKNYAANPKRNSTNRSCAQTHQILINRWCELETQKEGAKTWIDLFDHCHTIEMNLFL